MLHWVRLDWTYAYIMTTSWNYRRLRFSLNPVDVYWLIFRLKTCFIHYLTEIAIALAFMYQENCSAAFVLRGVSTWWIKPFPNNFCNLFFYDVNFTPMSNDRAGLYAHNHVNPIGFPLVDQIFILLIIISHLLLFYSENCYLNSYKFMIAKKFSRLTLKGVKSNDLFLSTFPSSLLWHWLETT